MLLLPDAADDWVGANNPVRLIEAFVHGLDLERAGFERGQPDRTERPGYRPADLLKLYLYGYLNRIRSSRRLEAEIHCNPEVIWLLRRQLENVRGEFSLTALVYNMRRAINLVGVPALVAAA